jgi:outer membrane protein TolC
MIIHRWKLFLLSCLLVIYLQTNAQNQQILSYSQFVKIVAQHHPATYQADLQIPMAKAKLLESRGNFDPVIHQELDQKNFNDQRYYSILQAGLKIPTRLGVSFNAGYEQMNGSYLNPENNMPQGGLAYAGISVPLAKDLLIDKRRLELQKAKLYVKSAEWERELLLNELMHEAGQCYWEWFVAYNVMRIYEEALELANARKNFVVSSYKLGDSPNIDTTEASIQVQNLNINLVQAKLSFLNASLLLSTYLWVDGETPLNLEPNSIPPTYTNLDKLDPSIDLQQNAIQLLNQHPKLEQIRIKLKELEVQQKFQKNNLLPKIDLKYNALNEPIGSDPLVAFNSNNFKWGMQFSMPIFLRQERGSLRNNSLHIKQLSLDSTLFKATLYYYANGQLNNWTTAAEQVVNYRQMAADLKVLLIGERRKFEVGESSIFMVNTREIAYINAQIKLIEFINKNQQFALKTYYAFGTRLLEVDE